MYTSKAECPSLSLPTKVVHIFLIAHLFRLSRYVDRLTESLKDKLTLAEKMVASQEAVREKGENSLQDARDLQPKLNTLIEKTRELQRHVSFFSQR